MEGNDNPAALEPEETVGVPSGDVRIHMDWLNAITCLASKKELILRGKPNGVISNATIVSFRLERRAKEKPMYQKFAFYSDGCFVWVFGCLSASPLLERDDDFELLAGYDSAWFMDGTSDFYQVLRSGTYIGIGLQEIKIFKMLPSNFILAKDADAKYLVDTREKVIKPKEK